MGEIVHSSQFTVHSRAETVNNELITINRKSAGFTLIEFLVVLGILVFVVGSSLLFLTSILKGSNQANVISEVKQNGQVVLDAIDRQIRNATNAEPVGSGKYVKLTRLDDDPLYVKCFNDGPIPKPGNGWLGTVVSSSVPGDAQYVPTTNRDDLVAGVDIQNCNFTVSAATTNSPAIVTVSFTVNQGINAPSRADFLANVRFDKAISLRKY
ncbi:type II secretion system protein [Candidatus Curtissbacteria bacterium]|nr:type II secretion system protein [Candidatus Curtissbacteria bacterium]